MLHQKGTLVRYFARNLGIVLGIVLVWRGIWELLTIAEFVFFGGSSVYTALAGIIVGLTVLYFPDRDLKELEKL